MRAAPSNWRSAPTRTAHSPTSTTPRVGIDEADLPRVFDVAYRGSNGRVPRSDPSLPSGSGLGLAIAAGLVRAHNGTLSAHHLGSGARFEVRLPLAAV